MTVHIPTWATARDIRTSDPAAEYVVRMTDPKFIAKVNKQPSGGLCLTVRKQRILAGQTQVDPQWLLELDRAAHYWATQSGEATNAKHAPELKVDPACQWPRYLLCEARLGRSFVLHTASPILLVEILHSDPPGDHNPSTPRLRNLDGQTLVIQGPSPASCDSLLTEISSLLGWLPGPACTP